MATAYRHRATRRQMSSGLLLSTAVLSTVVMVAVGVLHQPRATAAGVDRYVDRTAPTCSDTGPGTAVTPRCTIAAGVARLQPGDTLYVGSGSYAETIKPTGSGTADSPITITSWPGRSPTIQSPTYGAHISARAYVVLSGLTFSGSALDGIYVTGSNHVTVTGNTVTDAGQPRQGETANGISIRSTSASTVSRNTVDHNNGHGMLVTSSSTGNTIENNEASWNA
jgi:parallel beta-helix repeat protein